MCVCTEFLAWCQEEAVNLMESPGGVELLQLLGYVYVQEGSCHCKAQHLASGTLELWNPPLFVSISLSLLPSFPYLSISMCVCSLSLSLSLSLCLSVSLSLCLSLSLSPPSPSPIVATRVDSGFLGISGALARVQRKGHQISVGVSMVKYVLFACTVTCAPSEYAHLLAHPSHIHSLAHVFTPILINTHSLAHCSSSLPLERRSACRRRTNAWRRPAAPTRSTWRR
jgi:hypothetical protein